MRTITITIRGRDILGFNEESGIGDWGTYLEPFDANQFMTVIETLPKGKTAESLDRIPVIGKDELVNISIVFDPEENVEPVVVRYEIDHIRMQLVGEEVFEILTPRTAWKSVLDLDKTDGAIGFAGNFYLGQKDGQYEYQFRTSKELKDTSYNISYSIRFAVVVAGAIKYCEIDPLIRTSGGHG